MTRRVTPAGASYLTCVSCRTRYRRLVVSNDARFLLEAKKYKKNCQMEEKELIMKKTKEAEEKRKNYVCIDFIGIVIDR